MMKNYKVVTLCGSTRFKEQFQEAQKQIDMADEIFVINVGGCIGESTRREIAYAESISGN